MPRHRPGRGREALDVGVRHAPHRLHERGQGPQAASQDDGDRVLHARTARVHDILVNHDDPLSGEGPGADAQPPHESPCKASVVDEGRPAGGALRLQNGERCRDVPCAVEGARGAEAIGLRDVGPLAGHHPLATDLGRGAGAGQAAVHLRAHGHDRAARLPHGAGQCPHGTGRASGAVVAAPLAQKASAHDDVHAKASRETPTPPASPAGWSPWRGPGSRSRSTPTSCFSRWCCTAGRPRSRPSAPGRRWRSRPRRSRP